MSRFSLLRFFKRPPFEGLGKLGTQLNLNTDTVSDIYLPLPSLDEQLHIADFLDRETARIDGLMAKNRRLADLITERNRSFIARVVTRGLDPNTQLKASQVEWVGDVPRHWTIAPLCSRYAVQLGKMLDEKRITGDHLASYLRNIDVQWGHINVEELPTMDFDAEDKFRFRLRQGDLLVCEGGEVGRSAVWDDQISECYYQKALHRLRPTRGDNPKHMFYVMRAAVASGLFEGSTNLNTIGHLTAEKLRKYRLPFPPVAEQSEIVHLLEEDTTTTLGATAKIAHAISLLREYRSALISAAVTGQLDLREHEKQLDALA